MSNLSTFLQKPYVGLTASGDVLTYSRPNAQLLIAATDATAGGATYPQILLRNAYEAVGAGGQIQFQARNTTPADFLAAFIAGSLSTRTASAEVGQLDLRVANGAGTYGVTLKGAELIAKTAGVEALGSATNGFASLTLAHTGGSTLIAAPGTNGSLAFSGADFQIKSTGKTYNFGVSTTGAGVFNPNLSPTSMLSIGLSSNNSYYSQSNTTSAYGVNVDMGFPANVTAEANGVRVKLTTADASFTATTAAGIRVAATVKQGSAAITNNYGVYLDAQTVGTTNVNLYSTSAAWNAVLAGGGTSYVAGKLLVSNAAWTGAETAGASLDVVETGAVSTKVGRLIASSASFTGTMLHVEGPDNDSAYTALQVTDTTSGNTKFAVRGDGRVTIGACNTYDLNGATLGVDLNMTTSRTLASGKSFSAIYVNATVDQTAGSSYVYGLSFNVNAGAQGSGTYAAGFVASAESSGAGTVTGCSVQAVGQSGHTGAVIAMDVLMAGAAGSSFVMGVRVSAQTNSTYGLLCTGQGSATLTYGVCVGGDQITGTAAYYYVQNASSTADFLRYRNSSSSDVFKVRSTGHITSPSLVSYDNTDILAGSGAALATNATAGFLYVPVVGGTPTGAPTSRTGGIPLVFDINNNYLYFYNGGSWKKASVYA